MHLRAVPYITCLTIFFEQDVHSVGGGAAGACVCTVHIDSKLTRPILIVLAPGTMTARLKHSTSALSSVVKPIFGNAKYFMNLAPSCLCQLCVLRSLVNV